MADRNRRKGRFRDIANELLEVTREAAQHVAERAAAWASKAPAGTQRIGGTSKRGQRRVERVEEQANKRGPQESPPPPSRRGATPGRAQRAADNTPTPPRNPRPKAFASRGFGPTRVAFRSRQRPKPSPIKAPTPTRGGRGGGGRRRGSRRGAGAPTSDRVDFQASFSGYEPVSRHAYLSKLGNSDQIERWTKIKAGELPDDDDTPRPRTDEQLEEETREALQAIEQASRDEQDRIRTAAEGRESELLRLADRLENEAEEMMRDDPEEAQRLRRQADDAEEEASQVMRDANREWERVSERNTEQISDTRSQMRREFEAEVEQYEEQKKERIAELTIEVDAEIAKAINDKYFEEIDDEDWVEITDIRL